MCIYIRWQNSWHIKKEKMTVTTPSKQAYVNATTYIMPMPLFATASLANCNSLIKGFGNATDGDACTGAAQPSGGDGVGWFNKVWLE